MVEETKAPGLTPGQKDSSTYAKELARASEYLEKLIAGEERRRDILKEQEKAYKSTYQWADQHLQIQEKEIDIRELDLEIQLRVAEELYEKNKISKEILETAREKFKSDQASLEVQKRSLSLSRNLQGATKGIFQNSLGITDAWEQTFLGTALATRDFTTIKKTLKDTLTFGNIFGSLMMKIQESTAATVIELDQAVADLNKMTGAAGEYNKLTMQSFRDTQMLSVPMADVAKEAEVLHNKFSGFSSLQPEVQRRLLETSSNLTALGISAETSAEMLTVLINGLGMTAEEARVTSEELSKMALSVGMAPTIMAENFKAAMPRLMAYGDKSIDIFNELTETSRSLNIEMDRLLEITEQFDTFEGAAQTTGKLNALLGGDLLNSMQMLQATEDERIEMIRESLRLSGRQFDSMSKFERKALASAVGITDMHEAQKLFNESSFGLQQAAIDADKLREAQLATASMTKKFKQVFYAFAVAVEPALMLVRGMLDAVLKLNDGLGGWFIPVVFGLTAAVWMLSKGLVFAKSVMMAFGLATEATTVAQGIMTLGTKFAAAGFFGEAVAAKVAEGATISFGMALIYSTGGVILIGAAVAALVIGLSKLLGLWGKNEKAAMSFGDSTMAYGGMNMPGMTQTAHVSHRMVSSSAGSSTVASTTNNYTYRPQDQHKKDKSGQPVNINISVGGRKVDRAIVDSIDRSQDLTIG